MNADAEWLGAPQKPEVKITKQSAEYIRQQMLEYFREIAGENAPQNSTKPLETVLTYLAIHDALKTHPKQQQNPFFDFMIGKGIIKNREHDAALAELLQNPELARKVFPELMLLGPEFEQMLRSTANANANLGHFVLLEGTPDAYQTSLKFLLERVGRRGTALYLAHVLPDMQGVVPVGKGTVIVNEPKTVNFTLALESLMLFGEGKTGAEVVDHYVKKLIEVRYSNLVKGFGAPERILLVQMAEHYEAYTPERQAELLEAFKAMDPEAKNILIREKVLVPGLLDPSKGNVSGRAEILIQQAPKLISGQNATLKERLEMLASVFEQVADKSNGLKGTVLVEIDQLVGKPKSEFFNFSEIKNNHAILLTGDAIVKESCK